MRDTLNRPLHDLRISVIDRCNFRCHYCMPQAEISRHYPFLTPAEWLTFAEIERLVRIFLKLGVSKVRLTGGEPLLRPRLTDLIQSLAAIPEIEDLALTTNGALLSSYAFSLKTSGVNRLTVSLDSLDARIFKKMNGEKGNLVQILEGIRTAQTVGFTTIKINVVIQRGVNDQCIMSLVEYFRGSPHVLRFIEYMDVGNCNHWQSQFVLPSREILQMIHERYPLQGVKANYFGEVAERYVYADGKGEIGFISSITQPFCRSCTRARLSTDGKLYTCLFSGEGTDLRTLMRSGASDEDLEKIIVRSWQTRTDRYSEVRSDRLAEKTVTHKVEMFQIGG